MRRGGRRILLSLDHLFSEPLEPFPNRFAFDEAPIFFDEDMQFAPGNRDAAAEEVCHQVERDLAAKHEQADAFPSEANQKNGIFPVGAEQLVNFFPASSIGERVDAPERARECRVLKRAHQLEHRIPALALSVMADLDTGENDAGRHRNGVHQVGQR